MCPGNGTCCNRPEFDRIMFPCSTEKQLEAVLALRAERDRLATELAGIRAAIQKHHDQKADDRCWIDDLELYKSAGLPMHDPFVGDKAAMLENCKRFINNRCGEGGDRKSYVELEKELAEANAANERLQAEAVAMRIVLETPGVLACTPDWQQSRHRAVDSSTAGQSILRRLEAGRKCYQFLIALPECIRNEPPCAAAVAAYDAAEKPSKFLD